MIKLLIFLKSNRIRPSFHKNGPSLFKMKNFSYFKAILYLICFITGTEQQPGENGTNCTSTSLKIFSIAFENPSLPCTWVYQNFDHINHLHFECDFLTHSKICEGPHHTVHLYFNRMILSQTIDLSIFENILGKIMIILDGLLGFDIETEGPIVSFNPFSQRLHEAVTLIVDSRFDFYYRGSLIDEELCDFNSIGHVDVKLFK